MSENVYKPYRSCRIGGAQADVYIVGLGQADEVEKIKKEHDLVIVDDRRSSDPNIQIRDSWKITSWKDRTVIIEILLAYNQEHPTDPAWDRTMDSMLDEWFLHNAAYRFGVQPSRTGDVDLNNADEGKGLRYYLKNV